MKVQRADIDKRIAKVEFIQPNPGNPSTTTLAIVRLDNGFEVIGHSAAVDPATFDLKTGERLAYDDAITQLYGYFAFLKLESAHTRKNGSFNAALLALKEGKTVKRKALDNQIKLESSTSIGFTMEYMGGSMRVGAVTVGDILANDWEVVA